MAPPFGSLSADDSFYDSLPPLDAPRCTPPLTLFDGLNSLKQTYRLAIVDPSSGRPVSYPSDTDLERLGSGSAKAASPRASPRAAAAPAPAPEAPKEPSFQTLLAETHKTGGPVCSHCGATESPQWRRGPPHKAILCNACGTRYRRTNQLGAAVPSTQRKRGAAQHCGSEAAKAGGPPPKQPRVVA